MAAKYANGNYKSQQKAYNKTAKGKSLESMLTELIESLVPTETETERMRPIRVPVRQN